MSDTWLVATGLVRPQDFHNINPGKYPKFKDEFDNTDQIHILQEGNDLTVVCYDDDNDFLSYSGNTTIGFKFKKQQDGSYKVYRLKNEITTHPGDKDELDQAKSKFSDEKDLEEITDPREVARLVKALLTNAKPIKRTRGNFSEATKEAKKAIDTFIRESFLPGHAGALNGQYTKNQTAVNLINLIDFIEACTENDGANLDDGLVKSEWFINIIPTTTIDDSTFEDTVLARITGLEAANITNKRINAIKKAGLDKFKTLITLPATPAPATPAPEPLNAKMIKALKPFLTLENPSNAYKVGNSIYAVSIGADLKLKYQKLTIENGTISRSEVKDFDPSKDSLDKETKALAQNYENIEEAFNAAKQAKQTPLSLDSTNGNQQEKRVSTAKAFNELLQAETKKIEDEHTQLTELFDKSVANSVAVKKLKELAGKAGITPTSTEYAGLLNDIKTAKPLDAIISPDKAITETTLMKNLIRLAGNNGIATKSEKQIIHDIMKQIASHGGISHRQINQLRSIFEKYHRSNPGEVSLEGFEREITELIKASQKECPMSEYSTALSFNNDLFQESLQLNEFLKDTGSLCGLNPTTLDFDYFNYSGDHVPEQIATKYKELFNLITSKADAIGLPQAKRKEFMYRALMLAEATSNSASSATPTSATNQAIIGFDLDIRKKIANTTESGRESALHSLPANTDQTDIRRFTFFTEMLHSKDPVVRQMITDIKPNDRDLGKNLEALSTRIMDLADANGYSHVFSEIDPVENYKVNKEALTNIITEDPNKALVIAKTLGLNHGNPQTLQDLANTYGFKDAKGNIDNNKLVSALETHMNNFFNTYSRAQADSGATVGDQIKTYQQVFIQLRRLLNSGTDTSDSNIVAQPQKPKRISAQEFSRSLYNYLKFLSTIEEQAAPTAGTTSYPPRKDSTGVALWA